MSSKTASEEQNLSATIKPTAFLDMPLVDEKAHRIKRLLQQIDLSGRTKQNVVVEFGAVGRSPAQRIVQYIGMQSPAFVDIRQHQGALFWPSFNSREICTSFLNAIEKLDSWIKHVESTEKNSISTVPKKSKYEHVYAVYNSRAKQRIRWSEEDGASKEEPLISRVHPASLYLLCPENSVDVMITIEELCPTKENDSPEYYLLESCDAFQLGLFTVKFIQTSVFKEISLDEQKCTGNPLNSFYRCQIQISSPENLHPLIRSSSDEFLAFSQSLLDNTRIILSQFPIHLR